MQKYSSLRRLWGVIISCMVVIMIGENPYNKAFGCLEYEKIALLKIQDAINHDHTIIQWGTAGKGVEDCCRWEGVTCDPISKRIISLNLNPSPIYSNTSLDASMFQPFEELQNFNFSSDAMICLKGPLRLPKLQVLDLSGCGLISIPPMGELPSLKFLYLTDSLVFDNFEELTNSRSLQLLNLGSNGLEGRIPPSILALTSLKMLGLSYNQLNGSFPEDNLANFWVGGESSAPWYSYESQLKVRKDNLYYDWEPNVYEKVQFLTKSVYETYTGNNLYSMIGIDLSFNRLTGPMLFGNWDNVRSLNLSYNHFNGSIPGTLSSLRNLESLDLSHNMLSGKIPSEITELDFLSVFSVAYNNLSGPTPTTTHGQFATFDAKSYEGNPLLCGLPLDTSCIGLHPKLFAEQEQNDSSYKTTFLWSFFGSFVVSCTGAFVFIYFGTNIPQRFLVWIRVEEKVSYRRTVELPWKWNK